MGTRGCRIVKFKGRYWIFYNPWDSYETGMGNSLVEGIPIDQEGYQNWLASQRAFFAKWDTLLEKLLCITPGYLAEIEIDDSRDGLWHAAFDERLETVPPTHYPGSSDTYDYTMDLDLEVFSVSNGAHFRLNHIPRHQQWIEAMFTDGDGRRFVLPQYVPEESLASLTVDYEGIPPEVSATCQDSIRRTVVPKTLDSTASNLQWELFQLFQASELNILSVTLLGWTHQDLPFREIAFFILCLVAGGKNCALVDLRHVIRPVLLDEGPYSFAAMVTGKRTEDTGVEDARELITALGAGYYMQGLPAGSAPNGSKYWFEGALISLVPRLDRAGVKDKAIVEATRYGRFE